MYWEKEIETMDREKLEALQCVRFKKIVQNAKKSVYYEKVFRDIGLDTERIDSLDVIKSIPYTTKDDLRENWPYGLLAVPKDELIRMHASSGTTGRSTVIFHTTDDVHAWANVLARCIYMAGMIKGDVFQNMTQKKWALSSYRQGQATANVRFNLCVILKQQLSTSSPVMPFISQRYLMN